MTFSSLKTKVLFSIIIGVVVIEGFFLYLNIRSLSRQITEKTEEEAFNLSETIRLSIRNAMIKDRRDEYQRIINDVAQRRGIVEVRIFNKIGEIMVSSDQSNVGTVVDKQVEACTGCHREAEVKVFLPSDSKTRVYHTEKGSILGLINPIYNEPSCYSCHPKTKNVLGVLDIKISLEEFEKEKAKTYNRMIILGVFSVIILGVLLSVLLTRLVSRPIGSLLVATKKVAAGNLDQAIAIRSHDELGKLSESFNNMISELKSSRDALEELTQTLDQQVEERTTELAKVNEALRADIIERKRVEEEVRELLLMLEAVPSSIVVHDADGHFLYANQRAFDLHGYSRDEFMALNLRRITVPSDERLIDARIQELFDRGEISFEVEHLKKNGTILPLMINVKKTTWGGKSVFLSVQADITERKEAEEEWERLLADLEAKNRELESFVYTISHDLKAPLVSLNGFSGTLQKEYKSQLGEGGRHYLERIQANVAHMEALITNLLELSRIGRVVGSIEEIDVAALLREIRDELAVRLKEVEVEFVVQEPLPTVCADRGRIHQVFVNLIENAVKFRSAERALHIEVGCRQESGFYRFHVADNGIGIAPQYHEQIFNPFRKLHPEIEGMGIGLALVKKIVEHHGGRIWVESPSACLKAGDEGAGATFYLTLPIERGV